MGVDHYMSGTVSAVREAALFGKPAIALSQFFRSDVPVDWTLSAKMARETIAQLLDRELPTGNYWVVNFPAVTQVDPLPDIVFCERDKHPMPLDYRIEGGAFQYNAAYFERPRAEGTDVDVCFSGSIAVTLECV